jgi:hypothetical protein
MPRKHAFSLVVLLAAAAAAGLFALVRTLDLGQSAHASTGADSSIAFRMSQLHRREAILRKQLAREDASTGRATKTIYVHAPSSTSAGVAATESEGHGDDYEHLAGTSVHGEARDD